MSTLLLDVNVLVALAWPPHIHHRTAREWFAAEPRRRWATTPVTESGFIRVSSNAHVIADARTPAESADFLVALQGHGAWEFWTDAVPVARSMQGVMGYRQVTDAHLLQLAHDQGGSVATFDAGLAQLAQERGQFAVLIPSGL